VSLFRNKWYSVNDTYIYNKRPTRPWRGFIVLFVAFKERKDRLRHSHFFKEEIGHKITVQKKGFFKEKY